jgi:hypothetical protein
MHTERSRNLLAKLLEPLGVLATALFASAGVAILGIVGLWQRRGHLRLAWLWLWLGFFVPLFVISLISINRTGLTFVATLLPVCLLASFALQVRRQAAARGLVAALLVLLTAFVTDYLASAHVWQHPGFHAIGRSFEQVAGNEVRDGGTRVWSLPDGATSMRLQFEARHSSGASGWAWLSSIPDLQPERLVEDEATLTRATFPENGDPYLMRTFDLGEPAAGKTFRATVTLRSEKPVPSRARRGIWLMTWGAGSSSGTLPVALTDAWRTFEFRWTAPDGARDPVMRLVLNDFNGLTIEIKDARLEELRDGTWHRLDPLSPTGAGISLDWLGRPDSHRSSLRFLPTDTWQTYSLDIDSETLTDAERVIGKVELEPGLGVELRGFSLVTSVPDDRQPHPVPVHQRRSLWFGHPNNAGHLTLVTGLAALLVLRSGWQGLLAVLLALASMAFTGSRTAWLAGLVGLLWLLWFACRTREHIWVYGALAAAGGLALAFLGLEGLGRLRVVGIENNLSRPEIWRVAWSALTEHPWTGVGPGPETFSAYLSSAYGGAAPELVPNAHNLWLIFASEYGVFGLAAVLWLTLGLAWLGWQWGRWRGIAFVLPLFALNFYDYSLFSWWILFLVILGLNQLERDPHNSLLPVSQPKQETNPQTAKHRVGQPHPEPDLDYPLDR